MFMLRFFDFGLFPQGDDEPLDWDKLKKTGKVTEKRTEKDGIVTITKYYISNDGKTSHEETESYLKGYENYTKIMSLKAKLKEAEDKQDYEKCIELRDKITELKKSK